MATFLLSADRQLSVLHGLAFSPRVYSPYGIMNAAPVPGLAFCGQYQDPLTGSYPLGNGHRFYSPNLMRFITHDRLSPFSRGGINSYVYCGADPVNRHDPSGAAWSILLRSVSVVSSAATLVGSVVRTVKNVVGRRIAFKARITNSGRETPVVHNELPHLSRVSNQQFFITGSAGLAGQVIAATSGVTPALQTATDVLGLVNSVTNLSGGLTGNLAAAREVGRYFWRYPREIPGVALETLMDVTMMDEMAANVGRGLTAVANRISFWRTPTYEVQV
ncbi:RHS repeat-associated core domain-containing protein [Pseudomonas sp. USTB-Z]|uniref:RHS repeat-associated core domain-containing protein n=1 Tax=Pseudomonas sp. USTB-Z TaxID=2794351 RepID=UPI001C832722|nr:RHS repeat-associated core domain-containing protein [Pseudomonas sp. USTB-Z]MBX6690441.1 RHS repeat-associated core domain-containing protein [Pseudomonas sp. USTB-Z]